MKYMGGKSKLAGRIASLINESLCPGQLFLEPFCGGCWVTMLVRSRRRVAADANLDLIMMWTAIQNGWDPPMGISERRYKELKHEAPSALQAYAGFQCSYAGKWFQGYARDPSSGRNYAYNGRKRIRSARFCLHGVVFCCADYRSWEPRDAVIYCDPPYHRMAGYVAVGDFDHDTFWDQVRLWSRKNIVYVSEVDAPADFRVVLDTKVSGGLKDSTRHNVIRREKVFIWLEGVGPDEL